MRQSSSCLHRILCCLVLLPLAFSGAADPSPFIPVHTGRDWNEFAYLCSNTEQLVFRKFRGKEECEEPYRLDLPKSTQPVTDIAFNANGSYMLTTQANGTLTIGPLSSYQQSQTEIPITHLAIVQPNNGDQVVSCWHAHAGTRPDTSVIIPIGIAALSGNGQCIAIIADQYLWILQGDEQQRWQWQWQWQWQIKIPFDRNEPPDGIALNHNGSYLSMKSARQIRIWRKDSDQRWQSEKTLLLPNGSTDDCVPNTQPPASPTTPRCSRNMAFTSDNRLVMVNGRCLWMATRPIDTTGQTTWPLHVIDVQSTKPLIACQIIKQPSDQNQDTQPACNRALERFHTVVHSADDKVMNFSEHNFQEFKGRHMSQLQQRLSQQLTKFDNQQLQRISQFMKELSPKHPSLTLL